MEIATILIASGLLLGLFLLVLLIVLATGSLPKGNHKTQKKVSEDLKKIKAQISDD